MRPPIPGTPAGPSEIVCIVDRSGSMDAVREDAIGGFNAFVRAQREEPGEARLTLVLFNHGYERPMERVPLAEVPELTEATYRPGGTTALHDAIGRTLHDLGARLEALPAAERPESVVVAILTDGLENASRDYSAAQVSEAVGARRAEGWEFVFLAAGQDAVTSAARVNIPSADAMPFRASKKGTNAAFALMSRAVSDKRSKRREGK
jgi:hypothetical protein